MAESKNTFIKSKMNQDLDSRLIPNGEYRSAYNIAVSQSEGSDVGTLRTVLGNLEISDFGFTEECNVKIIGHCVDDEKNFIYLFFTNFVDTSSNKLSSYPSDEAICEIWRRDLETSSNVKLVEGKFLNFSLTHPISGINVLEELLFWTDNRNQPRKINISKANPGASINPTYYTNDDQINVIKYYPYDSILLINDYIVDYTINPGTQGDYSAYIGDIVSTQGGSGTGMTVEITEAIGIGGQLRGIIIINQGVGYQDGDIVEIAPKIGDATITLQMEVGTTMKDKCTEKLPVNSTFTVSPIADLNNGLPIDVIHDSGPELDEVDYTGALVRVTGTSASPYLARVTGQSSGAPDTLTIEWPNLIPTKVTDVALIEVGMNPDYDPNWPGDCEYLKDKFVRFGYRFKFDDNEYSLISPFTQACFIPKQNGYFLSKNKEVFDATGVASEVPITDTQQTLESTEVEFCENAVTNVDLIIPCPIFLDESISGFNNLTEQLHVEAIEIIYKDDAETVLKVLDVIDKISFSNINSNILLYDYQSRKPIKVLPESEITRVSDKVPLRALTQEVVGNRVMYGNYIDGHSSLNSLNYEVNAGPKFNLPENTLRKEYQNHTLKQNRNYQVGIVLSDRYGRQSDVILSSLDDTLSVAAGSEFLGSTIYHPYKPGGWSRQNIITDGNRTWPGDTLNVRFNEVIPTNPGILGYPGLFVGSDAPSISSLYGGAGYPSGLLGVSTTGGSGVGLTVNYTTFKPTLLSYITSVEISDPGFGYEQGDIITINGGTPGDEATFIYNPSQTPKLNGWYSYKIVVKQTEQDYYNVYLPGIVNGEINTSGVATASSATLSLYADNINKVPRDLTEVGPTQKTFNSSVELSIRVTNDYQIPWTSNQFYPDTATEKVKTLSELTDLGFTLRRITKDINTVLGGGTGITYNNFSEDIVAGMSVIITENNGNTRVPLSDNIYVTSTYINSFNLNQVNFNETIAGIAATDTITFGPPGIIYNSNNNPLIGILSTSEQIGVAEEDDFKVQLAVAETQPFESNLEVYYETTSAGLIQDLNVAIQEGAGAVAVPFAIETIDTASWSESQTGPFAITNNFGLLDATNSPFVDPNAVANLVSVLDANQNPRNSEFIINNLGNGTFNISTVKAPGEGFVVLQDENLTDFTFNVSIQSQGITLFKTFSESVNNERPIYGGSYDVPSIPGYILPVGSAYIFPTDQTLVPQYGSLINGNDIFSAVNGSGDTTLEKQELKWTIVSAVCVGGENKTESEWNAAPDGGNNVVSWPTSGIWGPFPNSAASSAIYQANPQPSLAYENFQILNGVNYSEMFHWAFLNPSALDPTEDNPIAATNKWGANPGLAYPGNSTFNNKARLCTYNGVNGGLGTQYVYSERPASNAGVNSAGVGWISSGFKASTYVHYIDFEVKIKVEDRNGQGLTPNTQIVVLNVRFQY